jgi:eukaryotic translation initiation factor 2C
MVESKVEWIDVGTSKPTHYHVLHDENRLGSDTLQELTYRMCYLYCRATRSVSVSPPIYYAHLVATRARFHSKDHDDERFALRKGGFVAEKTYGKVKEELSRVMYFM